MPPLVAEEVFDRETLERSWDEVRGALPAAVRKPLADKLRTYSTGLSPLSNAALSQIGHLAPSCDNRWFKKGELVQVFPYCKIFGVRDIDINQQTVEMDMQLTFDWKDEKLLRLLPRAHRPLRRAGIDWQAEMHKRCWHPSLMIENCASMKDVFLEHWFAFEPEGRENVLSFRVRLSGKFAQDFELTDLPFDEHFLTVKLRSSLEVTKAARPDGVKKIAAGVIFCRDEAELGAEVGKVTKASPVQIKDPAQLTQGVASFYEYELVHYTDRSDRSKGTQVGVGLLPSCPTRRRARAARSTRRCASTSPSGAGGVLAWNLCSCSSSSRSSRSAHTSSPSLGIASRSCSASSSARSPSSIPSPNRSPTTRPPSTGTRSTAR